MSPHSFTTSPGASGEQRKFINPTPGWVGASIFGPDGKPTSIAIEPGGEVWLTQAEERMTAEAPRAASNNPFVKEWEEVTETDSFGEPTATATRHGILIPVDEPARPTSSSRFVPTRAEEPETIKGAPPVPEQPPVVGQPSPDEIVATPEAVAANDAAIAKRKPTREQPKQETRPEAGPIPV